LPPAFVPHAEPSDKVDIIPLRHLDDKGLERQSVERVLFLSLEEMRTIRASSIVWAATRRMWS